MNQWNVTFVPTGLTKEYLEKSLRRAFREFYIQPRVVLRHAARMLHPSTFRQAIAASARRRELPHDALASGQTSSKTPVAKGRHQEEGEMVLHVVQARDHRLSTPTSWFLRRRPSRPQAAATSAR